MQIRREYALARPAAWQWRKVTSRLFYVGPFSFSF